MLRARSGASIRHCDRGACGRFTTVQKKRITWSLDVEEEGFVAMKSRSKKRAPSIVNLTVKRRYLTEREVERLVDCARKSMTASFAHDTTSPSARRGRAVRVSLLRALRL